MSLTTKRALEASFKKLLSKRSLDKITVKDIVEDCGVNRQTFYYHFHDVYDLMEWSFQDAAEALTAAGADYEDWTAGLKTLMTYLREERVLVLNAYHSVSHEVVVDYIKKAIHPYILQVVEHQAEDLEPSASADEIAFVTEIFTLAVSGVVTEWIGHRMQMQDTEGRLEKFRAAMSGSVRFMLHNLVESRE